VSRSHYSDCDPFDQEAWLRLMGYRQAVANALQGKRGQAFLREMLAALDALPQPRLIAHELEEGCEVCALGSVGRARQLDLSGLDPEGHEELAKLFGIAPSMVREIEYENDEGNACGGETPEERFQRMRAWICENLKEPAP
jgi:hypothetical protein